MITTRRGFLGLAAAGAMSVAWPSPRGGRARLRIGVITTAPRAGLPADARVRGVLDGVTLGADEASHTAMLFGGDIDLMYADLAGESDVTTAARSLAGRGAQVLLGAVDGDAATALDRFAMEGRVLVLHLLAPAPGSPLAAGSAWSMYVAPSLEARAASVLEVLHAGDGVAAGAIPIVGGDADVALARAIDGRVAARLGRPPLLAATGAPSDDAAPSPDAMLAIAARDAFTAAVLIDRGTGGRRVVDLFGTTEAHSPTRTAGFVRADSWAPGLERFGAGQLNDRFRARFGAEAAMRGAAWAGWFAMKAVVEAALRARVEDAASIRRALLAGRFDGHKGEPLVFSREGILAHPLYVSGIPETIE